MKGACVKCSGGHCDRCKQLARVFRLAVRRAVLQPGFAAALKQVGEVREGRRIMEGGLPEDVAVESLLMSVSRAVQAERKANR